MTIHTPTSQASQADIYVPTASCASPLPGALEEGGAAVEVPGDTGMRMSVSDLRLMEADAATLREARATAQLMLAGPDLFAACLAVLEWATNDVCDDFQVFAEDIVPMVEEAIKKARSGQ